MVKRGKVSLQELGEKYGVSAERVRQIEFKILRRFKDRYNLNIREVLSRDLAK